MLYRKFIIRIKVKFIIISSCSERASVMRTCTFSIKVRRIKRAIYYTVIGYGHGWTYLSVLFGRQKNKLNKNIRP